MRTSEEIYHRVRWDPRFDPARFVLGVAQRSAAPKRVPLERFTPGGDIPWHRVLFFEADGETVWDRSSGTDRIDATDAGRTRTPRRLPSPYFTSRTPHAYSPSTGTWEPAPAGPASPVASLTVLTWNTLWDRYDSDGPTRPAAAPSCWTRCTRRTRTSSRSRRRSPHCWTCCWGPAGCGTGTRWPRTRRAGTRRTAVCCCSAGSRCARRGCTSWARTRPWPPRSWTPPRARSPWPRPTSAATTPPRVPPVGTPNWRNWQRDWPASRARCCSSGTSTTAATARRPGWRWRTPGTRCTAPPTGPRPSTRPSTPWPPSPHWRAASPGWTGCSCARTGCGPGRRS